MRRVAAAQTSTRDTLIGAGRLFHIRSWSKFLKLLLSPLHALLERLEGGFDIFALFFEILDLLAGLLER